MPGQTWTIEGHGFTVTAERFHRRGAAADENDWFLYPDLHARIHRESIAQYEWLKGLEQRLGLTPADKVAAR